MSTPAPSSRTHPLALASFLLGLGSLVFFAVTGVPAVICGLRGLRAINASDGRIPGQRLALAGLALGGLGTLATVAGVCAIIFIRLQDSGRRLECANQLRQIGVALHQYEIANGTLPPATHNPTVPTSDRGASWLGGLIARLRLATTRPMPPQRRISWMAELLPFLGATPTAQERYGDLARKIDWASAWDDPRNAEVAGATVSLFLCRSHPSFRLAPETHYVGLAGVGADAAALPRSAARAGAFGYDRGVALTEMTGGITFTIVVMETAADNGPWIAGDRPTVRGLALDVERYCGPGRPFGGLHHNLTNVLWADGSVRPVSDETPGDLLRRQVTLTPTAAPGEIAWQPN